MIKGDVWKVDSDRRFGNTALRSDLSDMGDFLQRNHCVIHTVDIAGFATELDGAVPGEPGGALPRMTQNALFDLSSATGGEAFRSTTDIDGELRRLARRTSLVYVLAYRPDRRDGEGKYHALKVKVGRSGVKVVVAPRILREAGLPAAHAARAKPLRGRHHRQRDPVLRHRAPCPGDALRGARRREGRRGSRSSSRFREASFCRARRETGRPWRSTPTPSTVRNASGTSWPSLWAWTSRARARGSPREAFATSASCACRPATIACALWCATRTRAGPV